MRRFQHIAGGGQDPARLLPANPYHQQAHHGRVGASNVQPRDQDNGLEDKTMKSYCYWDGRIIKAEDGKFHM
jgi:hypothetical protein